MIWLAILLGAAAMGAFYWAWREHHFKLAAAQRAQLLTAALGTISGACYALTDGGATRVDSNPSADPWPADLNGLLDSMSEDDKAHVDGALQEFITYGRGFKIVAAWRLSPSDTAETRQVEISAYRLTPEWALKDVSNPMAQIDLIWVSDVSDRVAARAEYDRLGLDLRRARETLQSLPIAIWWRDEALTLLGGNRDIEELEQLSQLSADLAAKTLSTREACQDDKLLSRSSGKPQPLGIVERALDGIGTVGFAIDRSAIESVKAELARLVMGHREVLESVSTAIAIYGPDTRLMFHNSAFIRLWGIDGALLQAEPSLSQVLEALHEERVLPEYADFRRFKSQEMALFGTLKEPREDLMHLPDGRTIRLKVAPHPFGGLTFIYDDVTDRIALERSYNTLMEVQRETLDNLFEGIAVFGSDGRIKLWNPTFTSSWMLDADDIITRPHISTIVDKARSLLENGTPWAERREELIGIITSQEEYASKFERPDGRILELSVQPLPDGNVLWTFLDVTDASRVQRALQERNEALEESGRLKSEFIANVSYELRTPLNAIIGFAEILANEYFGPLNDRQKGSAQGILDGSKRLLELIDDILDLATIEAGHMTLERMPVEIHPMLVAVITLARERAGRLELNLGLDCQPDIGSVQLDQRRIRQALYNLVSNAIKFTPSGGSIILSARRENSDLILTVADTGIGIALEDQPHIFEKFERGDKRGRQVGAGLGLALVKSFVELHGGGVELTSEPGFGTYVTLRLPLSPLERPAGLPLNLHPVRPVLSNTQNAAPPPDEPGDESRAPPEPPLKSRTG